MNDIRYYITLPSDLGDGLANMLGGTTVSSPREADYSLVFASKEIRDPTIYAGKNTIVFAGMLSDESDRFCELAIQSGVPATQIFVSGKSQLDISEITATVKNIQARKAANQHSVRKLIGFAGCKGGVGCTTFAASLVAHYAITSEKAVLLETGPVYSGQYHLSNPQYGDIQRNKSLPEIRDSYRRIVIDRVLDDQQLHQCEKVIAVVDPDVIQSIEPTRDYLQRNGVVPSAVIYNKARAEVPSILVEAYFPGIRIVQVDDDFGNCLAALTGGVPAAVRSTKIAKAVGEIAALIDE